MRAGKLGSVGRLRPKHRVFDHPLHVLVIVGREGLVPGLEVENASVSAMEAAPAAENLATLVRGNENGFIGLGNVKGLAVHFLVGGTQANMTVIAAALRPYEGVLCAETGHINVHETGAIEATGHRIIELSGQDGKITADQVSRVVEDNCSNRSFCAQNEVF